MKKNKILDAIEQPLPIKIPGANHWFPKQKKDLEASLQICEQLKKEYKNDSEALSVIEEEENWLREGMEIIEDPNSIPSILLDELANSATLNLSGLKVPANTEELNTWKSIVPHFKDLNPTDTEIQSSFKDYEVFVGHYNGDEAYQLSLQEIADNVYTKEEKDGSLSPASKEEVMQAMSVSVGLDDFDDYSEETIQNLKNQEEAYAHLMKEFDISQEDLDAFVPRQHSTDNGLNAKSYDYINQMYDQLSYVDKDGNRWAASAEEVERGYELLEQAKASIEDPQDEELQQLLSTNTEHLNEASVRKFAGAWWLVIAAGIVAIFQIWSAFDTLTSEITMDMAANYKTSEMNSYQNSIKYLSGKETISDKDQKRIEEYEDKIADLQEISTEDYLSDKKSAKRRRGFSGLLGGLISAGWIIAYFFAARPLGYVRFKRQKQYAMLKSATGWVAKFLSAVLGVFWSIPITTYITKYSDGSEERDSDALLVIGIQLAVTAIVIGAVLMLARIIIPFAAIIAFIRNFPQMPVAKQIHDYFGRGKDWVQDYINKLVKTPKTA